MARLKIVYWRDIPGQVVFREGRRSTRLRLSPRFFRAIERAAYRVKKTGHDALFEPWRDVDQPCAGPASESARRLVETLEADYTDDVLDALARAGGVDGNRPCDA